MTIRKNYLLRKPGTRKIALYLTLLILLLLFVVAFSVAYRLVLKPNVLVGASEKQELLIPTGANFEQVVQLLQWKKWLQHQRSFEWVAGRMNYTRNIKPGRYMLAPDMSNVELVQKLRAGRQDPVKVVFHQIRTLPQLAGVVAQYLETDSVQLIQAFQNDSIATQYGLNRHTFASIFIPNTYELYWNTSATQFVSRMHAENNRFWTSRRTDRAREIGLTPVEVSILASIVEEETLKVDEMPKVAGLYLNRLRKGMLLQADPTVKFALGNFAIRRVLNADLKTDSPYNTYRYAGLPPGPIRLPSVVALDAVLNAASHHYLYMCAKEDFSGYHNFAVQLAQHQQNARRYRQALQNARIYR